MLSQNIIAKSGFLPCLIVGGLLFTWACSSADAAQGKQSVEQELLQRFIQCLERQEKMIDNETRSVLLKPRENAHSLNIRVPSEGILETAFGLDHGVRHLYRGEVFFSVSVSLPDGSEKTLFSDELNTIDVNFEKNRWHPVTLDLSEYEGQEVVVNFVTDYDRDGFEPKTFYDLVPTDLLFWAKPSIAPRKVRKRPNVILISIDTLRADHLGFMGYERETSPNMDLLAKRGRFFSAAVVQAPWTTPSHLSILTSTYPSVHLGIQFVKELNRISNDSLPTWAGILRSKGYLTAGFVGRGPISAQYGLNKGFDFYNETPGGRLEEGKDAKEIFQKAAKWLEQHQDRSFFLFVHTYEPHGPYVDDFFVKSEGITRADEIKYMTALYDGDIRSADLALGNFIESLEELGLMDETIIVLTSDHGEDLGKRKLPNAAMRFDHGHNLFDEMLLVPLIFVGSDIEPNEKGIPYQVRSIDILPSVMEYLNFPLEKTFQGKSLRAMIEGKDKSSRPAFSEATTYGAELESLRMRDFKYAHRLSYGFSTMPESRGTPWPSLHQLYSLKEDPGEGKNLADGNPEKVSEYLGFIDALFKGRVRGQAALSTLEKQAAPADSEMLDVLRGLGYVR